MPNQKQREALMDIRIAKVFVALGITEKALARLDDARNLLTAASDQDRPEPYDQDAPDAN